MKCMICSQDATHVNRRDGNADLCHTCFLLERRQVASLTRHRSPSDLRRREERKAR